MTTKIDRSKFKDETNVEDLKAQDQQIDNLLDRKSDYAGFHKIENGTNRFRIYPAHPVEGRKKPSFVQTKQTWWLPQEVEDKDDKGNVKKDKKGNSILVIKRIPVFDARIHSSCKQDIVAKYIEIFKRMLKDEFGDDLVEINKRMIKIEGSYGPNNTGVQGLIGKPSFMMYADKYVGTTKTFAVLDVGKAVKSRINALIAMENSGEVIGTEVTNPFTDIEDGRLLIITKNDKAEKAMDWYTTEIDSSFDTKTKKVNLYPLTDEDLEKFLSFPSLESLYVDVYTKKYFNMALKGLRIFDDENEFNVFMDEEFLEACEELEQLYPEPKEEKQGSDNTNTSSGDEFDEMSRDELKAFNRREKCGVLIDSRKSDDEIRENLRQWRQEVENLNQHDDGEKNTQKDSVVDKDDKEFAEMLDKKGPKKADDEKEKSSSSRLAGLRKKVDSSSKSSSSKK